MKISISSILSTLLALTVQAFASDKTASFNGSVDSIFKAAQLSAQKEWTLNFSDRNTHLISFVTGRSFFSHGMECSVRLHPLTTGEVEVVVHTQKKDGQAFAFGAGDRIAEKFFNGIRSELGSESAERSQTR